MAEYQMWRAVIRGKTFGPWFRDQHDAKAWVKREHPGEPAGVIRYEADVSGSADTRVPDRNNAPTSDTRHE